MAKAKQVTPTDEILVKIGEVDVVLFKTSNIFKVGEEKYFLTQIVWEEATDEVVAEISKILEK